jgi:ABC-type antimicrobial peptide transport system permease subunit
MNDTNIKKLFKLKKINVLKIGFFLAIFYSLLALIIIVPFGLLSVITGGKTLFVFLSMAVGMPILYGIIGFICGCVSGVLYNFVSKIFGGLEFEVETIDKFSE